MVSQIDKNKRTSYLIPACSFPRIVITTGVLEDMHLTTDTRWKVRYLVYLCMHLQLTCSTYTWDKTIVVLDKNMLQKNMYLPNGSKLSLYYCNIRHARYYTVRQVKLLYQIICKIIIIRMYLIIIIIDSNTRCCQQVLRYHMITYVLKFEDRK